MEPSKHAFNIFQSFFVSVTSDLLPKDSIKDIEAKIYMYIWTVDSWDWIPFDEMICSENDRQKNRWIILITNAIPPIATRIPAGIPEMCNPIRNHPAINKFIDIVNTVPPKEQQLRSEGCFGGGAAIDIITPLLKAL